MNAIFRIRLGNVAALALSVGILQVGCATDESPETADEASEAASAEATTAESTAPPPDTTGAAIWAHLQESDYADAWELWPDKGRNYPGQEPHGAQLTTLLNDVAYEALMSDAGEFPDGAIVVKQNFSPEGELAAVTTMYKVDGYNPDHADWFFTKHLASGELDTTPDGMEMEGRLQGCQSCHMAKQDNDYIYTGELGGS